MDLALIILNYKTPQMTIEACNDALASAQGFDHHLYVIDNASGDGSDEILHTYAQAQEHVTFMASDRNGGFGAGHNIGFRAALTTSDPKYIYIVNSDAFCEADTIRSLIALLKTTPQAGAVGSRLLDRDGTEQYSAFQFPTAASEFENAARTGPITKALRAHLTILPIQERAHRADWVSGASVMFRAEALRAVGGFDEGFFLYFEELDLFQRFAAQGWQVWHCPHSRLRHIEGGSTQLAQQPRKPRYWFNSRWRYFARHHGLLGALWITFARVIGGGIYRLRCLLERTSNTEPKLFLWDMMRHHIGQALTFARPTGPVNADLPK